MLTTFTPQEKKSSVAAVGKVFELVADLYQANGKTFTEISHEIHDTELIDIVEDLDEIKRKTRSIVNTLIKVNRRLEDESVG